MFSNLKGRARSGPAGRHIRRTGVSGIEARSVYYLAKRALDILLAGALLLACLPLIGLISLLIRLDSPGPVIFTQERVGAKRAAQTWKITRFPCYKFRTMYFNSDPTLHKNVIAALIRDDRESIASLLGGDGPILKLVKDPRVTRVGKILRKFSLDELPQFWNVIRGEMSLVGPRPAIPYELEMYKPWHFQRLETQPGVTGLWQVSERNCVGYDEMIRIDIEYIRRQTLGLDLKIILQTPFAVLSGKGAA